MTMTTRPASEGDSHAPTLGEVGWKFVAVVAQLALLVLLIRAFQLESRGFYNVMLLAGAGFVVHALLPLRFRLPWFSALSVASLWVVFGGAGFWILGIGMVLIGVCHLPVRLTFRVALLCVLGAGLAAARAEWVPSGIPGQIWPILGAMFMFRLALYLHSLKHAEVPSNLPRALAYFFMLPNVCFPLYPVVDYKTFNRQYFGADQFAIYQNGIRWMLRGVVHLLLYRVVYHHLVMDPSNVRDLGDLTKYMLGAFLLYLRVSGQFHLIVGTLHLFGFRLPETHRLYYLSASFTDFWRRINIYWKDFMLKLVYYPSFFWLRRFGQARALSLATVLVFAATWLLHSYQWFWLRGKFPISGTDLLFWGILGGLVVIATQREANTIRNKRVPAKGWSVKRGVKTVATFITICILWSLWSSESLAEWIDVLGAAENATLQHGLLLTGAIAGGVLLAGRNWEARRLAAGMLEWEPVGSYLRRAGGRLLVLGAVLTLALPAVKTSTGSVAGRLVASVSASGLNPRDAGMQLQGYYEALNDVNQLGSQLWQVQATGGERVWFRLSQTRAHRRRNDFILADMTPSVHINRVGKLFSTNRWGMRDREYDLERPADTYRMAMLGPSLVLGWGVSDGEPYEARLEERLNREHRSGRYTRYEILNFGYEAHSTLQQLAVLEDRVLQFRPQSVVITIHPNEAVSTERHLRRVLESGTHIPYLPVQNLIQSLGLTAAMPKATFARLLQPSLDSIHAWTLRELTARIRAAGATPVVVGLRMPTEPLPGLEWMYAVARAEGTEVIDLTTVYGEGDEARYRLADYDNHPNAEAHRIIADRLFSEFQSRNLGLDLGLGTSATSPFRLTSSEERQ